MDGGSLPDRIAAALAPVGLDLVGAAPVADYDRIARADLRIAPRMPWARSAIVVANGGAALWRAVVARSASQAEAPADPVDQFVEESLEDRMRPLLERVGLRFAILYAHRFASVPLSFVDLARAAGLGAPSLLRVLIHPRYGPWIALRAAVLLDRDVEAARPAAAFDPCADCRDRACVSACPGGAVRAPEGWSVSACVDHRLATGDCETACRARLDCVIGREHRYPEDALAHHQRRAWPMMRAAVTAR